MSSNNLSKRHREFFQIALDPSDAAWRTAPSFAGRVEQQVLNDDLNQESKTGTRTTLARWSPGTLLDRPVAHDFHEEVFLIEGDLVVGCDAEGVGGQSFGPYTFACRPPGAVHGPFVSRTGCLMLEFQYYD